MTTSLPMRRTGYVYLVRPVGHNVYKIGATVNLKTRLQKMQKHRAVKLEYVATILSDDYFRLEDNLLRKYDPYRLAMDWFALPDGEVEYLKGLAS